MASIALPKAIETAFRSATDKQKGLNTLSRHLRTGDVLNSLIEHRKQFNHVSETEYRITLETLLTHYIAGAAVGVNDLASSTNTQCIEQLANLENFDERIISRNLIRDSFIPLLREIEVIEGNGQLTWAYLDTPSAYSQFIMRSKSMYTAFLAQTEHEAKLKHALRDATALRKLEAVTLNSRQLSDDIGNELDYLKRQDRKHREQAQELGIPYSQIKKQSMKKHKRPVTNIQIIAFPAIAVAVAVLGFILSSDKVSTTNTEQAGTIEYYQSAPPTSIVSNPYGLTTGEYQWRQRYIALFKAHNGGSSKEMEDELFDMAAEHMISRSQMEVIVGTITEQEVQL